MHHSWERFWVPDTSKMYLSDGGFLLDPADMPAVTDKPRPLSQLGHVRALALLGEPGIGKSTALHREHNRISDSEAAGEFIKSYHINLNSISSDISLDKKLLELDRDFKESHRHIILHLDSLDEAIARVDNLGFALAERLRSLPAERLSVRIACRTVAWPREALGSTLEALWGNSNSAVMEMAPLRRVDVVTALHNQGVDVTSFLSEVARVQAVAFCIKPITLDFLIHEFKRKSHLPTGLREVYAAGCLRLIEERAESRRSGRLRGSLNEAQRCRVAGRIAVGTLIARRVAIYTGPLSEAPADDIPASTIAGLEENGNFGPFTISDYDIREVLDTGLFSSRGRDRMGWSHQTYEEFFAASYLADRQVSLDGMTKLMMHSSGGIIPAMSGVAAWLAASLQELRVRLVSLDPWGLLRSDIGEWTDDEIDLLCGSLIDWIEQGKHHKFFPGLPEALSRLRRYPVRNRLGTVVGDRVLKPATRQFALMIVESCGWTDMRSIILDIALCETDDAGVRARAIACLATCGDAAAFDRVKDLLINGLNGNDPDDEIRGNALEVLWPRNISPQELFEAIIPGNDHFLGTYARFIWQLARSVGQQEVQAGLKWATRLVRHFTPLVARREHDLADAVLQQAWESFRAGLYQAAFVDHILLRLNRNATLSLGSNGTSLAKLRGEICEATSARRQLLSLMLEGEIDRCLAWHIIEAGLVLPEDLKWLVSISQSQHLSVPGEEVLANLIYLLWSVEDVDVFEDIFVKCASWSLLRIKFQTILEGIPLDSSLRENLRNQFLSAQREQVVQLSAAQLDGLERLLNLVNCDDWEKWPSVLQCLCILAGGRVQPNTLMFEIDKSAGWMTLQPFTIERIVGAGITFLQNASADQEMTLNQNTAWMSEVEVSAVAALSLVHQNPGQVSSELVTCLWRKWAMAVAKAQRVANGSEAARDLLIAQLTYAEAETVQAVRELLRTEKGNVQTDEGQSDRSSLHPFLLLHDFKSCWRSDLFKHAMFEEMSEHDVLPDQYVALLDKLLAIDYEPAFEHAITRYSERDWENVKLGVVLLRRTGASSWPTLKPFMDNNHEFARGVFTGLADLMYHSPLFFAPLDEKSVAEIYNLMLTLFPLDADPERPSGLVTPLQMVVALRDGALSWLVTKGTVQAVSELRQIQLNWPGDVRLSYQISKSEEIMRERTWEPLSIADVFALIDKPSSWVIRSPSDLLSCLLDAMELYSSTLHGAQTPARDLWNELEPGQASRAFRPKDENALSDHLARFLRQRLCQFGIVVNREVEVKRVPGSPVGQRTDILVTISSSGSAGSTKTQYSAVIEVKGNWNPELFTAMSAQLVERYMSDLRAAVGIYVVGCYDCEKWDPKDRRRRAALKNGDISQMTERLGQQSQTLGRLVKAVVIPIFVP